MARGENSRASGMVIFLRENKTIEFFPTDHLILFGAFIIASAQTILLLTSNSCNTDCSFMLHITHFPRHCLRCYPFPCPIFETADNSCLVAEARRYLSPSASVAGVGCLLSDDRRWPCGTNLDMPVECDNSRWSIILCSFPAIWVEIHAWLVFRLCSTGARFIFSGDRLAWLGFSSSRSSTCSLSRGFAPAMLGLAG